MCRMIRYVWNKKAKSRRINYKKRNDKINYNVIKVGVNNDTLQVDATLVLHSREDVGAQPLQTIGRTLAVRGQG